MELFYHLDDDGYDGDDDGDDDGVGGLVDLLVTSVSSNWRTN